jgi:hypothetical protein
MIANKNNRVILEAVNITKTFPGVTALNDVSHPDECFFRCLFRL